MKEPTVNQRRFCEEYVIDSNATQAAIRAGYSEKTAQPASSGLLSKCYGRQAHQGTDPKTV